MRVFVYQGDEDGCGLASLRMLLLDLTKEKGYRYLYAEEDGPLSLEAIKKIAFSEGVTVVWKECEKKEDIISCSSFPMLALLDSGRKGHLVYIRKGTKKKLLVYDPASGPKWVRREELVKSFSLVYGEVALTRKERCHYFRPTIFSPWGFIFTSLCSLASIACLYTSLFFLGDDNQYLLVATFLAFYGLLIIASRLINGWFCRRFDARWLRYVPSISKKKLIKNYERYYSFKCEVFPMALNLIEGASIVFGLSFLFGYNDPAFFASAAGLAVYLVLESKAFRKKNAMKKEELTVAEEILLEGEDTPHKQLERITAISESAYRIGDSVTYMRVIYIAVAAALAFLPAFVDNNLTLNFYLFHLFGLIGYGQGARMLLRYFESRGERERAYVYFYDNFVRKENAR